jgi:maltose alpha-D-glucosyltransferase/alpha-amylase
MWDRVRDALENAATNLDNETQALARELREYAGVLTGWLTTLVAFPPVGHKTRHHGDYHLGQVLVSGEDAVIVDFEGEPLRPLDERRTKHLPVRDVAGMLRSIEYVSATLQHELPAALSSEAGALEVNRLNKWALDASSEFVNSYFSSLRELSSQPVVTAAAHSIVEFFLIEKALYEVLYELSNRPTWTAVPLRYLVSQLAQLQRRSES